MQKYAPPTLLKRLLAYWLFSVAALVALLIWAFWTLAPSATSGEQKAPRPVANATAAAPKAGTASAKPDSSKESPDKSAAAIPPFDPATAEYILTAFSTQGMQHVTDAEPAWTLLPPGNILVAQLTRRGPTPEPVTEGVQIRYVLDAGVTGPAMSANGTAGQGTAPAGSGELTFQETPPGFVSRPIAILPYTAGGDFAPYPMATVEARDKAGKLLASTRVVLPVSTEMGCRNCHTGPWKVAGKAGISKETADNILVVHDKRNNTKLAQQAAKGETVVCRSCHGDKAERLNLSTAIHGFHATMKLQGPEGCASCHPSAESGSTQFFRDFHSMWGLDCTRCHGPLSDHALSLLRAESEKGKAKATLRMNQITPTLAATAQEIMPRTPWVNLPQCSGCHNFTEKPDAGTATAFNKWTKTSDERFSQAVENTGKLRCAGCHGAPHAVYPSTNPMGDDRDNIQPLQYQKHAGPLGAENNCAVCHVEPMDYFVHHDRVGQ